MKRQRVLVVEDEAGMREFYKRFFSSSTEDAEFCAEIVPNGEQALGILRNEPVDILVLDWNLPGISGASLAKALRAHAKTRALGILMVTAKSSPHETVLALESGADDHLAKPFDAKVLLARLRSLARRRELTFDSQNISRFPGLELDLTTERLRLDGQVIHLTPKELDLLKIFLQRPNMLHTQVYLWQSVWGYESEHWAHILVACLSSLRNKLGVKWGARLKGQRGKGYTFDA